MAHIRVGERGGAKGDGGAGEVASDAKVAGGIGGNGPPPSLSIACRVVPCFGRPQPLAGGAAELGDEDGALTKMVGAAEGDVAKRRPRAHKAPGHGKVAVGVGRDSVSIRIAT